jgi:hypothetical protein
MDTHTMPVYDPEENGITYGSEKDALGWAYIERARGT